MLKASELRIGNLLEFSNGIVPSKIITVGRRFFSSASIAGDGDGDFQITPYYKPITLDEDWLLRFAEKISNLNPNPWNVDFAYRISGVLIIPHKGRYVFHWESGNTTIQYVHQLQNLYFALVGEELVLQD